MSEDLQEDISPESISIQPFKQQVTFDKLEFEGWEFYKSSLPMMNTKELDQISDMIPTHTLPDIVFGFNRLYFVNKKRNFLYEFSPIDSLSLSSFALQAKRIRTDEAEESKDETASEELNVIDLLPERVEVKMAGKWKDRDTSKIDDFKELEIISDWTYSTPYKGSLHYLDQNVARIKEDFGLEIELDPETEHSGSEIKVQRTEEAIPVDRLTPANPIQHYMELELFEDELDDCGHTSSKVRFRIMKD